VFAILSVFSFTLGMALTKLISPSISSLTILFFRSFSGFFFFLPFACRKKAKALKTQQIPLQIFRSILICLAMLCTYYVYRKLPLTTASAIGFTSPLFTASFAFLFLKEKLSFKQWIYIFIGYLGVLVIIPPSSFVISQEIWIALLANALASIAIIMAKKLASSIPTTTLLFYSMGTSFVFSSLVILGGWQSPNLQDILIMAGIGLCGLLFNGFYIQALKYGKASLAAPFEYTRLIFASIIGYFVFYELPDPRLIGGALIIALSTYFLTKEELILTT
jgi:drug/metabolite transporter (DMT)-like permease